MNAKKARIERTKKGYPAMWEAGGGYTNTGYATIIAGVDGQRKKAVYVRKRGPLANEKHALIIVGVGDYIIEASHHRQDFEIRIWSIDQILEEEAQFALVNEYNQGEWEVDPPAFLQAAIQAAMNKATCYHCREPHFIFIKEDSNNE